MAIERLWVGNSGRNYSYLVGCEATGEALAIDPHDAGQVLDAAAAKRWRIVQILNTHEHGDHTAGNAGVVAATKATVLAHARAARTVAIDRSVKQDDEVSVGKTIRLRVLETPGHTPAHICLVGEGTFFSGDTLFNAGVGNCHAGGDPNVLYETFASTIAALPDDLRVYPGHDYLHRNLAFTLDREPGNRDAKAVLERTGNDEGARAPVFTLGDERFFNVFLRVQSPGVQHVLGLVSATPKDVFLALRRLRDRW